MVAAHMKLAVAVLGNARRLQDDLVDADIFAARKALDQGVGDGVDRRADIGLNGLLRRIESLGRNNDLRNRCFRSC